MNRLISFLTPSFSLSSASQSRSTEQRSLISPNKLRDLHTLMCRYLALVNRSHRDTTELNHRWRSEVICYNPLVKIVIIWLATAFNQQMRIKSSWLLVRFKISQTDDTLSNHQLRRPVSLSPKKESSSRNLPPAWRKVFLRRFFRFRWQSLH